MDDWVVWLIAACVLAAGEIVTTSFFLAPFAAGAFLATIVSLLGAGFVLSGVVFLVASTLLFLFVRPVARRHLRQPAQLRTGTAALVGRSGTVVERIANGEGVGAVKIEGEVWTARAYDDDEVIEAGRRVHVMEIRGATALVSE
jgi:membrane protein implicated in regulation of membrane protease activity